MSPFQSRREYERYVYSLPDTFPSVQRSTLVVAPRGRTTATLTGELAFAAGYRLSIVERLTFEAGRVFIETYSYEAWRGADKLYWYDSQPHPNDPLLASTHPHHKHIAPDIKHNRVLAPGLSFEQPNLSLLVTEIEKLISSETAAQ
ncbi:MAG: toxin-antitoxin system TumE family protein [Anaerolineales bacterium]